MLYKFQYNLCRHCKRFDEVVIGLLIPDYPLLLNRFIVQHPDHSRYNRQHGTDLPVNDDLTVVQTVDGLLNFIESNRPGTIRTESGKALSFEDFFRILAESIEHSKHSPDEIRAVYKSAFTTTLEGVDYTFVDQHELLGD